MNVMSKKRKKLKSPAQPKELNVERNIARNKQRNVVALNPLLRKSAVHRKSTKACRKADKVQLKKTWFERVAA